MAQQLSLALQITVIGMGLVFGSILLLWAMMALLVRLAPEQIDSARKIQDDSDLEHALKQRAAVAAVTAALAIESSHAPRIFPLPPTALVSAWQAVRRSNSLNKRGSGR